MDIFWMLFFPAVFLLFLLIGAKPCRNGQWNDEFLSLKQTKALQGWSAVGIMLHHMGQKTAAPWLKSAYIHHGLDAFVPLGTFFVGVFLLSSGYGLYRSFHTKENYLHGFFKRRLFPILLMFAITFVIFWMVGGTGNPYAWYVGAILYLYLIFYLAFRFCKHESAAVALVGFGIVLYAAAADWCMLGTWCYNTVGLFWIGILLGKHETRITNAMKKGWLPLLILCIGVTVGMLLGSERLNTITIATTDAARYHFYRISVIVMQFLAAVGFVFTLLLMGMKLRLGNRVLGFLGGMSLEIYLIHGIFVQLFSYCYIDESKAPLYYIKFVPLYVLAVAALSIAAAFLLKLLGKYLRMFLDIVAKSEQQVFALIRKGFKRLILAALVIVLIPTVYYCIADLCTRSARQEQAAAYRDTNLTRAEVNGKSCYAYLVGAANSAETLVLMHGTYDACPTLTLRALAEKLGENYRVVVPDLLGRGFSDAPDTERSAQNITEELHALLHQLGITKNYILVPQEKSGLYAQYYVNQYAGEVKGVIGLNAASEAIWEKGMTAQRTPLMDYQRAVRSRVRCCILLRVGGV